eukprot:CAMPEP_0113542316 /NCGR_PEP_ID=MMETSP0015_2-20120614/9537_1 /TAXON_ID=2838 /ORGANISM="Odontella" /LENGTH=195 /DNA_ID=CAMNT_0000442355 /DNA_START=22 /DNA_END=606 /DNA_ORIENTATION=+ /assembly_acc=CAM_ASM_000160
MTNAAMIRSCAARAARRLRSSPSSAVSASRRSLAALSSSSSSSSPERFAHGVVVAAADNRNIGPFSSRATAAHARRSYGATPMAYDYPPHTLYPMPALSPTMETGTIAKWTKAEGESFSAGDVLCEIETDKATVDYEAQDDGIVAKILREGDDAQDLSVGVPICVVVEEEEDAAAFAEYVLAEDDDAAAAAAAPA